MRRSGEPAIVGRLIGPLLLTVAFAAIPAPADAQTNYRYLAPVANFTTASGAAWTAVTGCSLTFTPGSTSDNWVVMATGQVSNSSTSEPQAAQVRMLVQGTVEGEGGVQNNPANSATGFFMMDRITGTTAAQTINVQAQAAIAATTTTVEQCSITAFRVADGSDFHWDEVNNAAASMNCPDTPNTNVLTHQFTPNEAGEYLFIVSFVSYEFPGGLTNHAWVTYPSGAQAPDFNTENAWSNPRDARQTYVSMRKETLAASQQTLGITCNGSATGGSTIQWAKAASFRMDAYQDFHDEDVTELTPITSSTWTTRSTVTQTAPPASSEFLMLGTMSGCENVNSATSVGMRFLEDGVVQGDSIWSVNVDCSYSGVGFQSSFQWVEPYTTASAKTWSNEYQSSDNVSAVRIAESAIHVLRFRKGFSFRNSITINRANCPAGCGNTLANFPMLYSVTDLDLRTTANGGDVTDAQGDDILFRAVDDATCGGAGTAPCTLDHEIESYTALSGQLVAWVRIPSLNTASASSDTVIYIYYGNSDITTSIQNADGVWDTNYVGVWHLKEEAAGTGTVGLYVDSSGNGNHGTDLISATGQTGRINGGHDFDGVDDRVNALSGASLDDLGPLTVSTWIRPDTFGSANSSQIVVKSTTGADAGYWRIELDNTAPEVAAFAFLKDHATSDLDVNSANSTITLSAWNHLTATWNGSVNASGVRLYKNGSETLYGGSTSGVGAPVSDATLNMHIGAYGGGTGATDGLLDEIRISNIVRSSCWIGAEFNNQNAPGDIGVPNFYTVGSEESSPLTAVKLISFTATRYSRGVLAEWRTGYEIDNLGFHVYREVEAKQTRVTQSMVAGSGLMAGQGAAVTAEQRYATWDTAGPVDPSAVYWLQDLDFNGTSTWHGPVTPVEGGLEAPPNVTSSTALHDLGKGQGQKRRKVFLERGGRLERRGKAGARTVALTATERQWTLAGQAAIKIGVDRPGWYRLTQPELVAAGLRPGAHARTLRLFVEGIEQAMLVTGEADGRFDAADAIEFYGTGVDTPYTDTRTYWLVADSRPGRRMTVHGRPGLRAPGAPALTAGSFDFTLQQKERSIYFAALRNGDAENWFGALVSEEPVDLVLDLSNVAAGDAAELEVTIQGVTSNPAVDADHLVAVLVNGTEIGELRFDGQALGVQSFAIPSGTLTEGANTVTVVARGGEGDISLVDLVRLRYAHAYRADADLLRFAADGPGTITVGGFASRAIRVIDITDPLAAEELRGAVGSDGGLWAVTVRVPGVGPRTLLAFSDATVAAPAFVRANRPSRWHAATSAADYLAVVHAAFADALGPLVALRQQQGLSVARVDIEDVYDEFSFGEKTPQALRDFIRHARAHWKQLPRFLLLVGDATIDPRDYAGFGDADFVPTKQVPLDNVALETASDDWFVDVDDDGLPDVAIGRLPVRTLDQANAIVAKTVGYEAEEDAPWMNDVLFVADHDENAKSNLFEAASRRLEALLPQAYRGHELFSSQLDADVLRQMLASQVADGRLIVNYSGHGSTQLWGVHGNLLGPDDVNGWTNSRLPFIIAMNCLNGLFQGIYDEESLAETLLRAPQGGAVAVWASSGVTYASRQEVVAQELYRLIFQGIVPTLGEMVAAAKRVVSDRDVRRSWIFFGDPALRLKGIRPADAPTASSPQVVMAAAGTESDPSETENAQREVTRDERPAPVVRLGDFTGDGRDDLFLYDAERGTWTVAFSDTGNLRAVSGQWGSGLQVTAARLNGDAAADLVFYRSTTGEWAEALNAGLGRFLVRASGTGAPNQQLLVADFTGDGRDDRLMYDPITGTVAVTTHDRTGDVTEAGRKWPVGARLHAGDFNGDGLADLAGYDALTGSGFLALRTRNDFVVLDTQWGTGWAVTPARLSNRRRSDLVFYDPQTGAARLALSDGRGGFTYQTRTWPAGLAVQAADLAGDGRDDLFGYSPRSGVWWTAAFSPRGVAESSGEWTPGWHAATGDLNGDGLTDVLLYDPLSGLGFRFHTVTPGVFDYRPEAWTPGAALIGRP